MNANRMTVVAATVLASLFGVARADDITPDPYTHMVSTRTRAEVVAELHAARANGELTQGEDSGSFHLSRQVWASGKTRAEVQAEVLAARQSGEMQALSGEDSGSFYFARLLPAKRADDAARLAALSR
jgi:hypothetical protein